MYSTRVKKQSIDHVVDTEPTIPVPTFGSMPADEIRYFAPFETEPSQVLCSAIVIVDHGSGPKKVSLAGLLRSTKGFVRAPN